MKAMRKMVPVPFFMARMNKIRNFLVSGIASVALACGGGGSGGPTIPPPPSQTHLSGTMTDPKDDTGISGATLSYTKPDSTPGTFVAGGGDFDIDIKAGTSVRVHAAGYEDRTISSTSDASGGRYFQRFLGGGLNERFTSTWLTDTAGRAISLARWDGNCRSGESPRSVEVQVDAPAKYENEIRSALNDFSNYTRGAYNLAGAPFGNVTNQNPEAGKFKIVFTSNVPGNAAGLAQEAFSGSTITGVIIYIDARADEVSAYRFMRHEVGHGAGERGHSSNGGYMAANVSNPDSIDPLNTRTGYCLPKGYTAGSLSVNSLATEALPGALTPGDFGRIDNPRKGWNAGGRGNAAPTVEFDRGARDNKPQRR